MRIVSFNVPKVNEEAFRFQEDKLPYFYDQLHQHPELQIMLIEQGEGTLIAGDYLGRFGPGDLFVIGSELPHVFRSDKHHYHTPSKPNAQSISIYFNESYLGEFFWRLDELVEVRKFLASAELGFRVDGPEREEITQLIRGMRHEKGLKKIISFFRLLDRLSSCRHLTKLCITPWSEKFPADEGKRMNNVLAFTFREFHRKVYIEEVAEVAHLSPEAFCRFFKLRTRKTYTNFLNEVRVSQACKLLITNELSVQDICFQTGFSNLSNFNRIFKRITGKTPSQYVRVSMTAMLNGQ
jgi:AraC-like DNA-binding protein